MSILSGLPTPREIAFGGAVRIGTALLGGLMKGSYQRDYNFEFLPPGLGLYAPETIGQYCQEISFPQYNMTDLNKIQFGGEQRGYAGFFSISSMRATFLKPNPDIVLPYFEAWKRLIVDDKGFFGVKNDYALTSYILIEDVTKDVSTVVKLMGTFPTKFPEHSFSYRSEKVVEYSVEFNIDKVIFL